MNIFIGIGNLTKEPEIKKTQTGKVYSNFSIALNSNNTTDFINCIAWEGTATLIGKYLHKGSKIAIEGAIKNDTYEKDGTKIYRTYVLVNKIKFLDNKKTELGNDLPVNNLDLPF